MVGLVQLLVRETGIALMLGLVAFVLAGREPVFGGVGFILSLATAGVYAMGHALTTRLLKGRPPRFQQVMTAVSGLLLGWLLLVPMLGGESQGGRSLVTQLVTLYVALRLLTELIWPVVSVRRPVIKDQIVAQAERLLGRGARPYATRPDGTLDEEAISFSVEPVEAEACRSALANLLAQHRVVVSLEGPELVIRPAPNPVETA